MVNFRDIDSRHHKCQKDDAKYSIWWVLSHYTQTNTLFTTAPPFVTTPQRTCCTIYPVQTWRYAHTVHNQPLPLSADSVFIWMFPHLGWLFIHKCGTHKDDKQNHIQAAASTWSHYLIPQLVMKCTHVRGHSTADLVWLSAQFQITLHLHSGPLGTKSSSSVFWYGDEFWFTDL